jgi:hypothetical protein
MHNPLRFSLRRGALGALVVALALIPVWTTLASGPVQEAALAESSPFGIVEAYYRPDDARALNVGWERIIFEWAQFQPNGPDEFRTEVIPDEWLLAARESGREVVGLLKNTPRWASEIRELGAPPFGLDLPIDDPGNYWAAFVRRAVAHYGQEWGIRRWIIYNEPDIRPGELGWYEFDGEVEDYYQMLKVAYLAARSVNPDAVIHMAGMAWWTDKAAGRAPYLKRLLDVAAQDPEAREHGYFFDVLMVHTYFSTMNVWNVIVETKGLLWHYNLQGKPVWVAETNARPSHDPHVATPPHPPFHVSLRQQADYVVQAAALSLAAGVERFAIYRLYDDHFVPGVTEPWGLVRWDGTRRPAFDAYRMVIRTFAGTRRAQWHYSDRSSLVTLEQPGRTVYVMWARGAEPVRFHVAAQGQAEPATRVGVFGLEREQTAQTVPGVAGGWYVLEARGALPNTDGTVVVEGSPLILVADGPPRTVWVEVGGARWWLR